MKDRTALIAKMNSLTDDEWDRVADKLAALTTQWGTVSPADDETRCAICAWPYAATRILGCRPGDCSMRPFPPHLYAPARAQRDYAGQLDMSRFTNGNAVGTTHESNLP